MGVCIKDMEMPPVGRILLVLPSGRVLEVSADKTQNIYSEAKAIPVPKHGRLIDGDAVSDILEKEITMAGNQIMLFELTGDIKNKNRMRAMQIEKVCCRRLLDSMPTIIEAEGGEE